jgi:S-phase kinase-associated protein 1
MSEEGHVILIPGGDEPVRIRIPRNAAKMSSLIASMLQDDEEGEESEIPLQEVTKEVLDKVVEFLLEHMDDPMRDIAKPIHSNKIEELVGEWDAEFIDLEQEFLFRLILAANYMDIPSLLDLSITKVATMIKGKEPDEVKRLFNIDPDLTPEEEKLVRDQNQWIFEVATAPSQ